MHLLYISSSKKVNLLLSDDEHNHGQIQTNCSQRGLNDAAKEAVERYLDLKVNGAKTILVNLVKEKLTNDEIIIPSIDQLNNYISHRPGKSNKILINN